MIVRRKKDSGIDLFKTSGEVNRFGVKILPSGEQWILDAKTGIPARREGYNCVQGSAGSYLWLKDGDVLKSLDSPHPSIWENNLQKEAN
jgi:hypothetical protein